MLKITRHVRSREGRGVHGCVFTLLNASEDPSVRSTTLWGQFCSSARAYLCFWPKLDTVPLRSPSAHHLQLDVGPSNLLQDLCRCRRDDRNLCQASALFKTRENVQPFQQQDLRPERKQTPVPERADHLTPWSSSVSLTLVRGVQEVSGVCDSCVDGLDQSGHLLLWIIQNNTDARWWWWWCAES